MAALQQLACWAGLGLQPCRTWHGFSLPDLSRLNLCFAASSSEVLPCRVLAFFSLAELSSLVQAMELEEFQLLERQLSHETGDLHDQSLRADHCAAAPAAHVPGVMPSSQQYSSIDHPHSDKDAMGHPHSSVVYIPPSDHKHESANQMAGLPTEHPAMLSGISNAQLPDLWEPANAGVLSDEAPQQQHLQQQLRQQPGQAEAPAGGAAGMRGQAGTEQPQQAAYDQGVADWREQVDWAGPGMHAVAPSVLTALLPHELGSRHQASGGSTALHSSVVVQAGQGQPWNILHGSAVHAGNACPDPQAGVWQTRQDNVATVADSSRNLGREAAQDSISSTSESSNVSGATGKVRLEMSLSAWMLLAHTSGHCSG